MIQNLLELNINSTHTNILKKILKYQLEGWRREFGWSENFNEHPIVNSNAIISSYVANEISR